MGFLKKILFLHLWFLTKQATETVTHININTPRDTCITIETQ